MVERGERSSETQILKHMDEKSQDRFREEKASLPTSSKIELKFKEI